MSDTESEKTAALHEIAEEVEKDRAERGHSVLDGEKVVDNSGGSAEGGKGSTLASEVGVIPPAINTGN